MALLEGVIAFDRSVASLPWTSREAVTDLFRAQLSGQSPDAGEGGRNAGGVGQAAEGPIAADGVGGGNGSGESASNGVGVSSDRIYGSSSSSTAKREAISGSSATNGIETSGAIEGKQSPERSGNEGDKDSGSTDSLKNKDILKDKDGLKDKNGVKYSGMVGDADAVVEYWSGQMMGLLDDLRSVRLGGTADKTGGAKDKDMRWKPCEQAVEYRTLHRPGPNGTAIHTTCIEGVVHAPADAALAMSCDAPFFKEWWPNITMPSYRCDESKYIKRLGENFHLSFMHFKVPWPLPPQEFALIFVTVYDAASGMTVTVLRTLPEDPASADFTNLGYSQEDAPPPLPGHMRMGIGGGYAVKDMGEGRAHMRCIFTLDLKFPPKLVNFIIQQCGGIVYQWFTEELARIYDDPSGIKGKAFRQALHDEPLYNHVRTAMENYRAAQAAEMQQLEAEHQRKQQESAGGQQNGQAGGERNLLGSKRNDDEERTFRELGAEVEARMEGLVASVSRRGSSHGSSIDGDAVEIVESGEWESVATRIAARGVGDGEMRKPEEPEGSHSALGRALETGARGAGAGAGAGGAVGAREGAEVGAGVTSTAVTALPHEVLVPDSPLQDGTVQKVTVARGATVQTLEQNHAQNGRYGLRASRDYGTRNGYTASASDHRLFRAVDTLDRAIAALRLLHPATATAVLEAAAVPAAAAGAQNPARGAAAAAPGVAEVAGERSSTASGSAGLNGGDTEQLASSGQEGSRQSASGEAERTGGVDDGVNILGKVQQQQQQQQKKGGWGRLRKALTRLRKTG
ncbi:hypothetical protein CLOM_g9879 [Closterium sp. NIES-68]|nr:hypothetical protein CLOM_g9879 [Closterium sp. NIES-68]GJP75928.1 hypothetical protein CLOP_g6326 [Closterium sp. NIES-67]